MSNMIKASSIRYREEKRLIDVRERAELLDREKGSSPTSGFVSGLAAISLQEEPDNESVQQAAESAAGEEPAVTTEQENLNLAAARTELTGQERERLRQEVEQELSARADRIISEAQQRAEELLTEAGQQAETERQAALTSARQEGYAAGQQELEQEKQRLLAEYAQKERELTEEKERMLRDLKPQVTEVVIGLLSALTGVLLEDKKEIISYLISKALSESDQSSSFLIRVSAVDYEEVKGQTGAFRSLFEREVSLEVLQDALLKRGECMIETDYGILDCSLGTQLEGLTADLRLLGLSVNKE